IYVFVLSTILAGHALSSVAAEAIYPTRPVRILVGFPPGGAVDVTARIIGQKLSDTWGQAIIVDNRPGAGGTTGAEIAAKAAPDGYTLYMAGSSHAASAG